EPWHSLVFKRSLRIPYTGGKRIAFPLSVREPWHSLVFKRSLRIPYTGGKRIAFPLSVREPWHSLVFKRILRIRYAGGKRIVFPLNKMAGKVEKLDKIIFFKSIDAKTNTCTNKVVNGFFNSWSKRIRFGINIAYAHISATRE